MCLASFLNIFSLPLKYLPSRGPDRSSRTKTRPVPERRRFDATLTPAVSRNLSAHPPRGKNAIKCLQADNSRQFLFTNQCLQKKCSRNNLNWGVVKVEKCFCRVQIFVVFVQYFILPLGMNPSAQVKYQKVIKAWQPHSRAFILNHSWLFCSICALVYSIWHISIISI